MDVLTEVFRPETPDRAVGDGSGPARGHAAIRSYLRFIGTFKGSVALVASMFAIASALLAVIPLFVGRLVQALSAAHVDTGAAYRYTAILIACSVLHDIGWRTGELLYLKRLNHRGYEYENLLFRSVIGEQYPYFVGKSTGKISSYIGTLGREFRDMLDDGCFTYVEQVVKLPSVTAIMFTVNLYSGLAFTGSLVLMFLVARYSVGRAAREEKRAADAGAELDGHVIDVIANFVSVKSFLRERAEYTEVRRRRQSVIAASNRSMLWNMVFWASLSGVVRYVVWPATILLNLHLFLTGQESVSQFTTFLAALVVFCDYIWGTVWQISRLNLSLARIEEAYHYLFAGRDILADPDPGSMTAEPRLPPVPPGALQLRGLTFAYPENLGVPVLNGIHVTVAANEKVGIVGRSGSGKTTLIKLLLGYYPLPLGMIAIDGRPVANRQLAQGISYVPQDTTLFHRSIRENITYGSAEGVTLTDVEAAARRAHAHEFVVRTVDGYDTLVGERGIKLSTGQRQRIAIARAFLDDKPMLVLDEATSALDSESEVLVQGALEDLWRDKTVIAVAHRLSTLLHMDRIVVLEDGHIAEQGSHDELLDARGRYFRLWQRQSGGMIAVD